MRVDLFDFDLPAELIAQSPAMPRDSARMMVIDDAPFRSATVADLPDFMRPDDLLVVNDTKVLASRVNAICGGRRIELTFLEDNDQGIWTAFAKPGKRLKPGRSVVLSPELSADVTAKYDDGRVALDFGSKAPDLLRFFEQHGRMPLPPYIKRAESNSSTDSQDYQTLFADKEGAVAAPTAGLHFTPALLDGLAVRGIVPLHVTLHVGTGTFLPVKVDHTGDHRMHSERFEIGEATAKAVNSARMEGRRVVAVGTTVLRTLEASARDDGLVHSGSGSTDLFITPGFDFRIVDLLLTNFHLPKSTLFMLVSAFAGRQRMLSAYDWAIAARMRFYSYGDATLITRSAP